MSGYVPRRVLNARIGTTIEKNQTPMQAGLAPRVGKSGASIRLYYQRVDGCCDFCDPEPIQILKRGIFPGNTVTGGGWPGAGIGLVTVNSNPSNTATDTNVFYVIVFNREITPSPAIVSNPSGDLRLRTPLGVNWNTYVLQNSPTGGEVLNNNIYSVNIPSSDYKLLDFGNFGSPAPTNADIGRTGSGWQIVLDGTTQGAIQGGGAPATYPAAAGLVPAEQLGLNNVTGAPGIGGPLDFWAGSTINSRLGEIPPGLDVGLRNPGDPTAPGFPTSQISNNGCMSYLVTNESHFGGYALVFNITRLILASQNRTPIPQPPPLPPPLPNYDTGSYTFALGTKRPYRSGLANITWYNTGPNPAGINTGTQDRNNIGISYTPNEKTALTNTDNCGFAAPIAPFKISIGDIVNPTNLPILTLIDSDTW